MSNHETLKAQRKKELLAKLESKKKDLRIHFEDTANKSIDAGKGILFIGTSILLLYTVLDRFLDAKFRTKSSTNSASTTKSSTSKIVYPIFSMLLQQGMSTIYDQGQKRLVDYLKNKKESDERLPRSLSKK